VAPTLCATRDERLLLVSPPSPKAFFEWQTRGGWKLLAEAPEVKALIKWFHFASDTYLSAIGQTRVRQQNVAAASFHFRKNPQVADTL
jgi:hypothetical protein